MNQASLHRCADWTNSSLCGLFAATLAFSFVAVIAAPIRADTQTPSSPTPISLTTIGSAYTQDFDTLATSGTSSTLPTGWAFSEGGGNANSTYTAGTGSSTNGDTYSFGVSGTNAATDRAFGTLLSGTLVSTIGATFTNNTAITISSLAIAYRGELWRLGTTSRTDELDFQYSTNATSLSSGTWTGVSSLNFITPDTTGSVGARDGNASGYFNSLSYSITGLSIANGTTFWIRWVDIDASGSDDGLAIDDFSLTPQSASVSSTWSGSGGNNNWSTASNWNSTPANGSGLVFAGATRLSNSNDSLTSVSTITFANTAGAFTLSGNSLTVAGGITNNSTATQSINLNLTLSAAQQFNAASGNLLVNGTIASGGNALTITGSANTTLAGVVSGTGGLVKTSAGTLTLSGNNSYSGGTTVSAGMLTVGHVHALGTGGLTINGTANTTLQSGLTAPVQLPSLTIAGGGSPTATLDITDNNLIVHNGNLATLTAQIKSGLNFGGALWAGTGITSSTAALDAQESGGDKAVGIMLNNSGDGGVLHSSWPAGADSGGAVAVTNTDILIKYTYFGDANLDGVVDSVVDYSLWATGLSGGGEFGGWLYGDFNYDGIVDNTVDYSLWATGYFGQGSPLNAGVQPVPEPSTLLLAALGLAGAAVMSWRRSPWSACNACNQQQARKSPTLRRHRNKTSPRAFRPWACLFRPD